MGSGATAPHADVAWGACAPDPPADSVSRASRPWCGEAGGGQHRILETRDRILTEGCGRVSASPEHVAVAGRHRSWVNYWFGVSWSRRNQSLRCVELFPRLPDLILYHTTTTKPPGAMRLAWRLDANQTTRVAARPMQPEAPSLTDPRLAQQLAFRRTGGRPPLPSASVASACSEPAGL